MVWVKGHPLQSGKYLVQDVLGQGGFGITYKVLHTVSDEFVVIKTPNEYLKYDPDYDKYVDRFIKEGQRLAQLSQDPHPHIVRVWDLFKEGEVPCMVMDFIPGENLFQLARRRGALPEVAAVECIRQIGEALSVIHQVGLVHRDAHPGNIIVRPDARAILIDFGIAKDLTPSTQSSTGEAGNKGFAPYEQISRGSREPTVDVYCLAATLYFAVTGKRPVTSLDRRLHNSRLIPPKQIKPDLSEKLNQAILKGMALESEARPQSMQGWLDLLEESKANFSPALPQIRFPKLNRQVVSLIHSAPWKWLSVILAEYVVLGALSATPSSGVGYESLAMVIAIGLAMAVNLTLAVVLAVVLAVFAIGGWVVLKVLGAILVICMMTSIAGAIVEVWAGGETIITTFVSAVFWSWAVVLSEAWDMPTTWAKNVIVALVCAITVAGTKDTLSRFFQESHTFLILVGTSLVGLCLGWLIGTVLRSSGFTSPTFGIL